MERPKDNYRPRSRSELAGVPTRELLHRLGLDPEQIDEQVLREVGVRYLSRGFRRGERADTAVRTAARLQARYGAQLQEHFIALALDGRLRVIRELVVAVGGLSTVHVRPREVFRELIVQNAASTIVSHNHPSGDAEPSAEDLLLTQRLVHAGELLAIPVIDHIIVTEHNYVSLHERGHIPAVR